MVDHIKGVCQRAHDLAQSRPKEKIVPIPKKILNEIKEALKKLEAEDKVDRYGECNESRGFFVHRGMGLFDDGKYVLYSDYLKLLKKYQELKDNPMKPLIDYLDEVAEYAKTEREKIIKSLKKNKKKG
jgi:hypothetical protein